MALAQGLYVRALPVVGRNAIVARLLHASALEFQEGTGIRGGVVEGYFLAGQDAAQGNQRNLTFEAGIGLAAVVYQHGGIDTVERRQILIVLYLNHVAARLRGQGGRHVSRHDASAPDGDNFSGFNGFDG